MTKSLMLLLALLALCLPASAQDTKVCGAPVALNDGWTIASQAEVGLDAARLCQLDAFIAQWPKANIHAVVVVRNGKLVMERYFAGEDERWGDKLGRVTYGPEVKHDLRSISKSVTSLLVGIALQRRQVPGARTRRCSMPFPTTPTSRRPRRRASPSAISHHVVGIGMGREPAVGRSAQ